MIYRMKIENRLHYNNDVRENKTSMVASYMDEMGKRNVSRIKGRNIQTFPYKFLQYTLRFR